MGFNGKSGFGSVLGSGGGGVEVPLYIETNLVFDFDFEQTEKQSLRIGIYLENYVDRGISMSQGTAAFQPIMDTLGLAFDGFNDFMTLGATGGQEIWVVCNNIDGAVFNDADGLFSTPITSDDYIYAERFTTLFRLPFPSMKINNVYSFNFGVLNDFKTVSQEMAAGGSPLEIGNAARVYYWNGYIKRILIYDAIKTPQEKQKIQSYLRYKYSL